jgi:hypothetical protein
MSRRWSAWRGICAGRSRWGWRSIIRGGIRRRYRVLTRVAQDAERALASVQQAGGLLSDEAVKAAHELRRELIGQDFDIDQDGVPRLHRGTRIDRIISAVDTEMRHGRKSSQQRFDGYRLSAAATTATSR